MKNVFLAAAMICCLAGLSPLLSQSLFLNAIGNSGRAEEARRIIRTPDDNFLIVGYTTMSSMDREGLVIKMSPGGTILWAKTYGDGGPHFEEFYDVVYAGGYYYCVGYTRKWVRGTFINGMNNVIADIFLVKLKTDGSLVWAKNMGKPSAGTSATDGNDIGLRLIGAAQGGVVVVARINSGANTKQNNGLIWVDPDAKTKWAYQYDWPGNANSNELTYGIWKDKDQNYITGGWINTFGTFFGGLLMKVDQSGDLVWVRNTRCSPGIFESQYYGFYNHNNGKVYTTDVYDKASSSIRQAMVMTNLSSTGDVPASGAVPQAVTFHYGTSGSSGNNHRAFLFPVGDGFQELVLVANNQTTPSTTTRYATLVSADADLDFQWSKKIGFTNVSNFINDLLTCDGENRDLVFVGATATNTDRQILLGRTAYNVTDSCSVSDNINTTNISTSDSLLTFSKINLNSPGCIGTGCWAGNDTIPLDSITVANYTYLAALGCTATSPGPGEEEALSFIEPVECDDPGCAKNLSFNFAKQPNLVYFEITDITGDFVYERFYGQADKLNDGYKFDILGFKTGDYKWELFATYDDEKGVEQKYGGFTVK